MKSLRLRRQFPTNLRRSMTKQGRLVVGLGGRCPGQNKSKAPCCYFLCTVPLALPLTFLEPTMRILSYRNSISLPFPPQHLEPLISLFLENPPLMPSISLGAQSALTASAAEELQLRASILIKVDVYPKAQNSRKALSSMVCRPKGLKI